MLHKENTTNLLIAVCATEHVAAVLPLLVQPLRDELRASAAEYPEVLDSRIRKITGAVRELQVVLGGVQSVLIESGIVNVDELADIKAGRTNPENEVEGDDDELV